MRFALLALAFTLTLSAQPQRQVVRVGGAGNIPADWPQPERPAERTDAALLAAVDVFAQKLAAGGHFSGVLLVAKDGRPVLERVWGIADEESKNTKETRFNVGSINKVFTRKAIEQLAAAGKLTLDDVVLEHLPDAAFAGADRITIRQLLEHRSGMGDFFGPKYQAAPPSRLRELSDFVPLFADAPLEFEPGTSQRYSNAGYVVLGLIVEKISGQRYRDYVQQHVFAPAGMKSTGFWAVDEKVPNRATGWTAPGASNASSLPGRPSSAGGAFSTARDLLRYFLWSGEKGVGVAGGSPGVNAIAEIDEHWAVIALSNFSPPSAEALGLGAMQILRGAERAERRGTAEGPAEIDVDGPVAVPLHALGHMVSVDATVNGKGPYRFVVDTGAGGSARVSAELAAELDLPRIGEARSGDPSGKNVVTVPLVRVDSLEIGGARFGGVEASAGGGQNVIGLGLFGRMSVTLDYPKSELRLSLDRLPADGAHVVPFTRPHGIPVVEVVAGGVRLAADVDSGSPALLTVQSTSGVPLAEEPRVVGRGRTVNNEFEIRSAPLRGDLVVAGHTITSPALDLVDHFPNAHLGSRFLRPYAVTFDLENLRMGLAGGR